jgi:DNA-directed RNA polymerase specialized sigma24 family protein
VNDHARLEFAEFVAARSGALIRLAYVLTGDQHTAEDLLQTALTRAAARWARPPSWSRWPCLTGTPAQHRD